MAQINMTASQINEALETAIKALAGETGKKYKIVACVLRNTGAGWAQIDGAHQPINVASVTNDTTKITVTFNFEAANVCSFLCTPDETMVAKGYNVGARAMTNYAEITISQEHSIGGMVKYNAANSQFEIQPGSSGLISVSFSNYLLRIQHEAISGICGVANSAAPLYEAIVTSITSTDTYITFQNHAGAQLNAPDANHQVYFQRFAKSGVVNPNDYVNAAGNIWVFGVFEVA